MDEWGQKNISEKSVFLRSGKEVGKDGRVKDWSKKEHRWHLSPSSRSDDAGRGSR